MDLKKTGGGKSKLKAQDIQGCKMAAGNPRPLTPQVLQVQGFGFALCPLYFMF